MDFRNLFSTQKHLLIFPLVITQIILKRGFNAAELAIYQLHWAEGKMRGDWKSRISISVIQEKFGLSKSTALRAYKKLVASGFMHREKTPIGSNEIPLVEVLIPDCEIDFINATPNKKPSKFDKNNNKPDTEKKETDKNDIENTKNNNKSELSTTRAARNSSQKNIDTGNHELANDIDVDVDVDASIIYDQVDDDIFGLIPGESPVKICRESIKSAIKNQHNTQNQDVKNYSQKPIKIKKHEPSFLDVNPEKIRPKKRKVSEKYYLMIQGEIEKILPPNLTFEILNQVIWCLEEGGLRGKIVPTSALIAIHHIKINEWHRPNGMPPNWHWIN